MEQLKLLKNGQWSLLPGLKKSWGSPIYDQVAHGKSPFKDNKAATDAKIHLVKTLKTQPYAKYQRMVNEQNGKPELHVLLHRGIGGDEQNPIDVAGKGPNMLNFSSGTHVETDHNSVHTLHPEEAIGHAEYDGEYAKHISFWAPLSSIHGNGKFIDKHFGYDAEEGDEMHALIAPGKYRVHSITDYVRGVPQQSTSNSNS
jgi:hypothetical protein